MGWTFGRGARYRAGEKGKTRLGFGENRSSRPNYCFAREAGPSRTGRREKARIGDIFALSFFRGLYHFPISPFSYFTISVTGRQSGM
jgi:hypothetical protein